MHRAVWLSLLLAACGKADNDWVTPTPAADASGAAMTITGVVHHFELEGGFYAIRGDDSVTYDPTNLPAGVMTPAGQALGRIEAWMHGTMVGTATQRPCATDAKGTYTCLIKYSTGVGRIYWNPFRAASVTLASSARKKVSELGVTSRVKGGQKLKVTYMPVLVKSKK